MNNVIGSWWGGVFGPQLALCHGSVDRLRYFSKKGRRWTGSFSIVAVTGKARHPVPRCVPVEQAHSYAMASHHRLVVGGPCAAVRGLASELPFSRAITHIFRGKMMSCQLSVNMDGVAPPFLPDDC